MTKIEVTVITMRKQIAIYFEVSGYFVSRYSGHYVYPAEQYTKANHILSLPYVLILLHLPHNQRKVV